MDLTIYLTYVLKASLANVNAKIPVSASISNSVTILVVVPYVYRKLVELFAIVLVDYLVEFCKDCIIVDRPYF